jgi:hypothetical protein
MGALPGPADLSDFMVSGYSIAHAGTIAAETPESKAAAVHEARDRDSVGRHGVSPRYEGEQTEPHRDPA